MYIYIYITSRNIKNKRVAKIRKLSFPVYKSSLGILRMKRKSVGFLQDSNQNYKTSNSSPTIITNIVAATWPEQAVGEPEANNATKSQTPRGRRPPREGVTRDDKAQDTQQRLAVNSEPTTWSARRGGGKRAAYLYRRS
jgi:hypothetical protein